MELKPGSRLGPYEIVSAIGAGGMGEVYKARDVRLNRFVAIKTSKAQFNERFRREARAIAALNHPHICQLYDIGPDYLVLEYVDGGPLAGPLPVNEAVRLAIQIVEALLEAHGKGILHRDLKPGNIMVTAKGAAKLLDFGLAKMTAAVGSDAPLTMDGSVMGTAAYMSPEQAQGKPVDERSDIFSLGAVFYEMLSGTRAFKGNSTAEVLSAVLRDNPAPLSAPLALSHVVMQCLAKQPEKRFQMAAEVEAVLKIAQAQILRSEQASTTELDPNAKPAVPPPLPMVRRHTVLRFGESNTRPRILREEVRSDQAMPATPERRNRHALLQRVRQDWIVGVLKQSLYGVARIELGLEGRADSVEQPLRALVQILEHAPAPTSPETNIAGVFDESGGALLILGQPGTGKTTLLLELAEGLLNRAGRDEGHPIPVVFTLTSWALRCQRLKEWLVAELNERYDVPTRLAKQWVESEQILPLLDGLDEVASPLREGCVEAINDFRREHGLVAIAVCSRIADYETLGRKLRLRRAVVVQPLTSHQIQDYLEQAGDPTRALRLAANEDPVLAQLIETPLMLWVAVLAYHVNPVPALNGGFEQQRAHLFGVFVNAMFDRRTMQLTFGRSGAGLRYDQEDATKWLSWLAGSMIRLDQTIFHMESLDKTWVPSNEGTIRWHFVAALAFSMARSLGVLFSSGMELSGHGLVASLTLGCFGAVLGAGWGGFIGVCLAFGGALDAYVPVDTVRWSWDSVVKTLVLAVEGAIESLGGMGSVIYALNEGFAPASIPTRGVPNAGVRSSLRNGLTSGILQALLVAASFAVLSAIFHFFLHTGQPFSWLVGGLLFGVALAPFFGLEKGAGFYLRNRVLRQLLRRKGYAPKNYVDFLDFCCERLFLQRVGGGYKFVHRTLMEYFASSLKP